MEKTMLLNMNDTEIISTLKSLGKLPLDFNGNELFQLLDSKNSKVKMLAIKNIGKLKNIKYLEKLFNIAQNDEDSNIRREATSAIGRIKKPEIISYLIDKLDDIDPKVILQAIRGLLYFKDRDDVVCELKKLKKHKNEHIKLVIEAEFYNTPSKASKIKLEHAKTYDYLINTVVNGDVLEVLKSVPDEAIHLTFTSPPYYNARDYSIYQSYKEYLEFLTKVFQEVHRITKEGRFFILNTSPVIVPRISRKHSSRRYPIPYDIHHYLIEMGWDFIDDIIWEKPEASVKNRNGGFYQHRKPLAYKPNNRTESVMVYRKKTTKLIDWNMKQYPKNIINESKVLGDYETSNVWKIDPSFDKKHTAVFPLELCNRVVKFYSYIGDLVFDPFAGSGTVGLSAKNLGRNYFLTEKDKTYFARIKERIKDDLLSDTKATFYTLKEFQKKAEN